MRGRRALLLAFAAAVSAAGATEGPAPLLSAVARTPALEAARRRIDAAQTRAGAAGRLADPEVEAMASRVNGGSMGDDRSMWVFNLRQPLPRRGERAADRERATAAVSMAEADLALIAGETTADAAMALAEAEGARTRLSLLEIQHRRLGAALSSLDAR
ncbi:MAG: TolC family protein, partial [Opitutaceae bacterium]